MFFNCWSSLSPKFLTDVAVLHRSYVWSEPAVGPRNRSLHLRPQLIQLHGKGSKTVHLQTKKNTFHTHQNRTSRIRRLRWKLTVSVNERDLSRIGRSGFHSPQQLAAGNHVHAVCRCSGNLLLPLSNTQTKQGCTGDSKTLGTLYATCTDK